MSKSISAHSKFAKNRNFKSIKQPKVQLHEIEGGEGFSQFVSVTEPNADMKKLGAKVQYDTIYIKTDSGAWFQALKRGLDYSVN